MTQFQLMRQEGGRGGGKGRCWAAHGKASVSPNEPGKREISLVLWLSLCLERGEWAAMTNWLFRRNRCMEEDAQREERVWVPEDIIQSTEAHPPETIHRLQTRL